MFFLLFNNKMQLAGLLRNMNKVKNILNKVAIFKKVNIF